MVQTPYRPTFLQDLEQWLDRATSTPFNQLSGRDQYNYHRLRTLLYMRGENRGRGLYYGDEFKEIEKMVSNKPFIFAEYTSSLLFGGDKYTTVFQNWISQLERMKEYQIKEEDNFRTLLEKYPDECVEDRKKMLEDAQQEQLTIARNILRLTEGVSSPSIFIDQPYVFAGHLHNGAILLEKLQLPFFEGMENRPPFSFPEFSMRFYYRMFSDGVFGYDTRDAMKRTLEEFDSGLGSFGLLRQRITEEDVSPIVVFIDLNFEPYSPLTEDVVLETVKRRSIQIDKVEYSDLKYCPWEEAKFRERADERYTEVVEEPVEE